MNYRHWMVATVCICMTQCNLCGPAKEPDIAYRVWVRAVERRDIPEIMGTLSQNTNKRVRFYAESLGYDPDHLNQKELADILFGLDQPGWIGGKVTQITVEERDEKRAIMSVYFVDKGVKTIVMIREAGQWKLDLSP